MDYKSRFRNLIKWGIEYQDAIFAVLILALIFFIGLGLGLLIKSNKRTSIIIDKNIKIGLPDRTNLANLLQEESGNFVASINGKAYYPKNCKAASVIKEENRIWFDSAGDAQTQGYSLAKNCQ